MAASAFRAGRFAPLSREEAKPGKDTTTIDRQYPKCWVETLKMFLQVANNGTAVWEVIFSTWYPGKVSLLAAQRSRFNIQGSISPQTPLEHTRPMITETVVSVTLCWTGRKKTDPGNVCYKVPDTLWHELNGLGNFFFFFFICDKWPLHCPGSCHLYVLLQIP